MNTRKAMLTADNISVSERTMAILNCLNQATNLKSDIIDAVEELVPDEDKAVDEVSIAFGAVEDVIFKYLNKSIYFNQSTLASTEI